MKFTELFIQTQRTAPSEIRTDGLIFLYRAGYVMRSGQPTLLGQLAIEKLHQLYAVLDNEARLPADNLRSFLTGIALRNIQSHNADEYFVPIRGGDVEILHCPGCGYAAPREIAVALKSPYSREEFLPVEKVLTPGCNTIAQLADFMQIPQEKTAKALMFTRISDGRFVFVLVRGDMQLSEAKLKAQVGVVRLATADEISASGAVAGYASPVGLIKGLVVVDDLAARSTNLVAGANEFGYHLKNTNHGRDYLSDLVADVTLAGAGDLCQVCHGPLEELEADIVAEDGRIQFEKLLQVLAEYHHDEKGLALPATAAPFEVYLMSIPGKMLDTAQAAESLYAQLEAAGISVLFDDRDERAGVKFNDADLIGCPLRVTVGERGLQGGMVELKARRGTESQLILIAELVETIKSSL